jgi:hypothetical protein
MHTHTNQKKDNRSRQTSEPFAGKQNTIAAATPMVDNRAEFIAQRTLQLAINNSPRMLQLKALQDRSDNRQPVTQLQAQHTKLRNSNFHTSAPSVIQAVAPGRIAHIRNSCFIAAILNTFATVKSLQNLLIPAENNLVGVSRRLPELQSLLLRATNSISVGQMIPNHWVMAVMYSLRKNGIIADYGPQDVNEVLNLLIQRLTVTNGPNVGQSGDRPVTSGIIPWDRRTDFIWTILSSVDRHNLPNVIHLERMAANYRQASRTFYVPIPQILGGGRAHYRLRSMVHRDTTTFDEAHFVSNVDVGGHNQEWHQSDDIGPRVSAIGNIEAARSSPMFGIPGPRLMDSSVSYIYERIDAQGVNQGHQAPGIMDAGIGRSAGKIALRYLEIFNNDYPKKKQSPTGPSSKSDKEEDMVVEKDEPEDDFSDLSDEEEVDIEKINTFYLEKIKKLPMKELSKKVYEEDSSESEDDTPDPKDKVKEARIKRRRQVKASELEAIARSTLDLSSSERSELQKFMKHRKSDYGKRGKKRRKYGKDTQKLYKTLGTGLRASSFYHNRYLRRASRSAISKSMMESGGSGNYSKRQGPVRKELLKVLEKDHAKMKWTREDFSSDDMWQVVQFLLRNKLSGQNAKSQGFQSMKEALASKVDMSKSQPKVTSFTEFHHLGFKEALSGNLEGLALNLLNLVAVHGRRRESDNPEGDYGYHQFLHDVTAFDTGTKEFEERAGKTKDERGKIGGVFRDIDMEALYYLLKYLVEARKSKKDL